jgi:hypothetical protein
MSEPSSRQIPPPPPSLGSSPPARFGGHVRNACVLALLALALMVWSQLDQTPIPVVVAMSVGQAIGTLSLLYYGVAILVDFRRRRVIERALGESPKR